MNCDKCGQPVTPDNNAVTLEAIVKDFPPLLLLVAPRHFLPTGSCEGSPSRAQYIEGQPRDSRPDYPYDPAQEVAYRAAYALMQDRSTHNEG